MEMERRLRHVPCAYEPRHLPQDGPSGLDTDLCQIPGGPRADPKTENRLPNPPLTQAPPGVFSEINARELDFKDLQS